MHLLAPAHGQMPSQAKIAAVLGQGAAVHEFRPRLGQRPFFERGKFFIQLAGENQLQHGVAQKLQPLVGLTRPAGLMGHRWMRQRELQQSGVAKRVSHLVLKFLVSGHGAIERLVQPVRVSTTASGCAGAAFGSAGPGSPEGTVFAAAVSDGSGGGFKPCSSNMATSR